MAYIPSIDPITPQGNAVSNLFIASLVISGVVFLLVAGLLLSFLYRSRGNEEQPSHREGNRRLEIAWTVIPFLLVASLFVFSVRAMNRVDRAESGTPLEITATGHQWWWEFEYPELGVVTANELHVPVGRPVRITVTASDVIHSFWVPEFGWKIDAIPSRDNVMRLTVDEAGTYEGACAEFCGTQHAWMRIRVVAEPPEQFAAWTSVQQQPAQAPSSDLARRGREVFLDETCVTCHTVSGTDADGDTGPNLTHLGSRATLGAGVIENSSENLADWIQDAHAIKPGVLMPPYSDLSTADLQALAAWLEGLE